MWHILHYKLHLHYTVVHCSVNVPYLVCAISISSLTGGGFRGTGISPNPKLSLIGGTITGSERPVWLLPRVKNWKMHTPCCVWDRKTFAKGNRSGDRCLRFQQFNIINTSPIPPINKLHVMMGSRCIACRRAARDIECILPPGISMSVLQSKLYYAFFILNNITSIVLQFPRKASATGLLSINDGPGPLDYHGHLFEQDLQSSLHADIGEHQCKIDPPISLLLWLYSSIRIQKNISHVSIFILSPNYPCTSENPCLKSPHSKIFSTVKHTPLLLGGILIGREISGPNLRDEFIGYVDTINEWSIKRTLQDDWLTLTATFLLMIAAYTSLYALCTTTSDLLEIPYRFLISINFSMSTLMLSS